MSEPSEWDMERARELFGIGTGSVCNVGVPWVARAEAAERERDYFARIVREIESIVGDPGGLVTNADGSVTSETCVYCVRRLLAENATLSACSCDEPNGEGKVADEYGGSYCAMRKRAASAERERDELRAEVERLRDGLLSLRAAIHACNRGLIPNRARVEWRDKIDSLLNEPQGAD